MGTGASENSSEGANGDLPLGVVSLAGLSPDGISGPRKKGQMTPCTVPKSSYLAKVTVKSTLGLPDVGDLPLGVVSLAGLPPYGNSGPGKNCRMTPCSVPHSSYLAKVAVKSTLGCPDVGDLPLGVVSLAGLSQMAVVA